MTVFLTSSPTGALDGSYVVDGLDERNGFVSRLREVWPQDARCLMITAFPDDIPASEEMTAFFASAVKKAGLSEECFELWDCRTQVPAAEELQLYDVIFLGGGHVPTQNAFFARLGLREKLIGYKGIIIGISAGSMNCADSVYAQPELPGEALDPAYSRYLPGLALTDINVLPHYQMVKDYMRDGMRLFADITCPDCEGRKAVALPDGSYILIRGEKTEVFGEAYRVLPYGMELLCREGESAAL